MACVGTTTSRNRSRGVLPTAEYNSSEMADNPLNAVNRGVYISDNLPFLRRLNDGCIDLVCIDPPFGKRADVRGSVEASVD